jgi:hemerythrin-like domain-containing protein
MEKTLNLQKFPVGSLITEHRLVERYLRLMRKEANLMEQGKNPDRILIERMIDFFHTYAHRCHYGKEEGILFRDLHLKKLSPEHKKVIDELVLDHIRERDLVDRLEIAKDKYWLGDSGALKEILTNFKSIMNFYPGHIQKEEKQFFPPAVEYFSKKERENMLREFAQFDQNLIHEKYIQTADRYEGDLTPSEYGTRSMQLVNQPEVSFLSEEPEKQK